MRRPGVAVLGTSAEKHYLSESSRASGSVHPSPVQSELLISCPGGSEQPPPPQREALNEFDFCNWAKAKKRITR